MKSFIGLALIAGLCSVELSQAAAPITNTLKVTDRNHLKKADRDTEFICEFTTTDPVTKVGIYKDGVGLPIIEVTSTGTTFTRIDGKINAVTADYTNKDFHKAMFSVTKANAPVLEGRYFCKVTLDQDYASPDVTVYSDSEIVGFAVTVKDALKDRPTEFKTGGQLDGACAYDIPSTLYASETLTKLEILSGDRVIAAGDRNFLFTYPKPEGFSDVKAEFDLASHKATFTVAKLTDKSAGEFRCRYSVEDQSTPKITKDIVSNGIVLTHTNVSTIITDVMLTIEDKNHLNKVDRETVFACTFTKIKDAANIVVNVVKTDETPAITIFTVDATGSSFSEVPDKIMSAEFDHTNKDGQKTRFTLKKAESPAPSGVYRCDVRTPGAATVSSKTVKVYTNSELISFNVRVDNDKKNEFNTGTQLHGSCAYDIPVGETLKKLEVSSDGRNFISGVYADDMFTFTYNKLDGFTDVRAIEEDKKVTFTAINLADMSAGKFRCNYDVMDESEYKIKKFIYSNEIELKDNQGSYTKANVSRF